MHRPPTCEELLKHTGREWGKQAKQHFKSFRSFFSNLDVTLAAAVAHVAAAHAHKIVSNDILVLMPKLHYARKDFKYANGDSLWAIS